jgi:hypothetical protein
MPWRAPGRAHQQAGQCEGTARVLGGDFLGSGVVRPRHQSVEGRSGTPDAYPVT